MLADQWSVEDLRQLFAANEWKPVPPAKERHHWIDLERSPLRFRQASWLIGRAEGRLGSDWSALPAHLIMRFARDGDRDVFETAYYRRRNRLAHATLAECFEGRGRFVDEVIDGLWLLCDEASWAVPTHFVQDGKGEALELPSQRRHTLDLFSAETAITLAEANWLLHDEIEQVSPRVRERIQRKIRQRVFDPFGVTTQK